MSLDIDNLSNREKLNDEMLDQLFRRLKAQDIEQFYMAYQLWSQRQQIEQLQLQMLDLQRKIDENTASMQQFQPSAVAMASLAQLQACGVEDTDLLDRMLERGEEWLDHSIELLERCEQLDLIGGDYTQWCEHALEGAYDWIDSMTDPNLQKVDAASDEQQESSLESTTEVTEEQLLRKLMSEDEDRVEQESTPEQNQRITQPPTDEHTATTEQSLNEHAELSSAQPMTETDQNISSDSTKITESSQNEQINNKIEMVATPEVMEEKSGQEPHLTNIEENKITTSDVTEQKQDLSSSKKRTSKKKKGFLPGLLAKFRKE
jgi:hypothetical protein